MLDSAPRQPLHAACLTCLVLEAELATCTTDAMRRSVQQSLTAARRRVMDLVGGVVEGLDLARDAMTRVRGEWGAKIAAEYEPMRRVG